MYIAAAVPTAADPPPPNAEPATRVLEIRFTGSGSEYFRIWAINLLLILLSCGLYLPFAKIRRIRYLYANTLIDGEALAFHGDAGKMFRGFVLLCAVWPALWRASMQFRLGNTSWRGLRFGFEGSLVGAYLAYLPVYIPAVVLTALVPHGQGPSGAPGVNSRATSSAWTSGYERIAFTHRPLVRRPARPSAARRGAASGRPAALR